MRGLKVLLPFQNGGPEVKKKLEEVRILESRKSARLLNQGNTDFSKLADFNIVHERRRINSETSDISGTRLAMIPSIYYPWGLVYDYRQIPRKAPNVKFNFDIRFSTLMH